MTTLKQERTPEDVCDGCRRGLQVRLDFAGRPEHVHESPDWPWVKLGGSGFSYIETCSARIMETPTMADPTLLERLRELQGKATPPTWALDENKGAGLEICAHVPHLDRAAKLQHVSLSPKIHVEEGKVFVYVSYESWNQFPSSDWKEMQRTNAQLIVTLVNALPEILEALEDAEKWRAQMVEQRRVRDLLGSNRERVTFDPADPCASMFAGRPDKEQPR